MVTARDSEIDVLQVILIDLRLLGGHHFVKIFVFGMS